MNACATLGLVIGIFGNSLCYVGFPTSPTWPALLDEACTASVVYNCSPGRGTVSPGWDLTDPLIKFEEWLALHEPHVAVVDLITNDHYAGLSLDESTERLAAFIAAARAAGAEPVLVGAWPLNDGFSATNRGWWVGAMNGRIHALGAALGATVIDPPFDPRTYRAVCTDPDGAGPQAPDGTHPYVQACRQDMADEVAARLP